MIRAPSILARWHISDGWPPFMKFVSNFQSHVLLVLFTLYYGYTGDRELSILDGGHDGAP
jgi:hypothetical protein